MSREADAQRAADAMDALIERFGLDADRYRIGVWSPLDDAVRRIADLFEVLVERATPVTFTHTVVDTRGPWLTVETVNDGFGIELDLTEPRAKWWRDGPKVFPDLSRLRTPGWRWTSHERRNAKRRSARRRAWRPLYVRRWAE